MIVDHELENKLASSRFKIDRVYRWRHIIAVADKVVQRDATAYALVKAHDERWCDVVFEFARRGQSAKWICYAIGRSELYPWL